MAYSASIRCRGIEAMAPCRRPAAQTLPDTSCCISPLHVKRPYVDSPRRPIKRQCTKTRSSPLWQDCGVQSNFLDEPCQDIDGIGISGGINGEADCEFVDNNIFATERGFMASDAYLQKQ